MQLSVLHLNKGGLYALQRNPTHEAIGLGPFFEAVSFHLLTRPDDVIHLIEKYFHLDESEHEASLQASKLGPQVLMFCRRNDSAGLINDM